MKNLKRLALCLALLMGGSIVSETTSPYCYAQGIPSTWTTFTGKVGGKYAITMNLLIPNRQNVSCNFRGSYYYGNGKNGSLTLSGHYENGRIYMDEYNPYGEWCGSWSVTLRRGNAGKSISGNMTNSKGKTYSVSVRSRY